MLALAAVAILSLATRSAHAQEIIPGMPTVATNRATINFSALANFEAEYKARHPGVTRPSRAIPFQNLFRQEGDSSPATQQPQREASMEASTAGVFSVPPSTGQSPSPSVSFPALDDNLSVIPPDTMGAVGPNHVMTTLNSQVRIQDREGTVLSTMDLNTFWAPLGFADAFDPHITYDPYAQRWIFSAAADAPIFNFFSSSRILLAVSATSDPTGQWYLYGTFVDVFNFFGLFFGTVWADYPTLGFNKNWIVVSANMYTSDIFEDFAGVQIFAFNKADLYTNGLGALTIMHVPSDVFGLARGFTMVPSVTYDRNLEEMHLVDVDNYGNNFVNSRLRLSKISGDIGREILTLGTSFTTNNNLNWAATDFGFREGFAEQAGSTFLIANNDARMQNVVYRNGSLWCTHTVFLPANNPNHSAVQWWQVGPTPTNAITYQFGRIEQTNNYFAVPSIAVNRCNDVLIGYSSFSANKFASANYSFRLSSDPPGTLQSPALLKAGEAPYFKTFNGFENRWGDYSAAVVDPLNDIDMWTIQEYAATPAFVTIFGTNQIQIDRWGTWWGKVDVASISPCGQVEFAQTSYAVNEGGVATIAVTNITGAPGTVEVRLSNGTASGTDYDSTPNPSTLTFAAGQTSASFDVTTFDDADLNGNRTVNLELFNPTGAFSLGGLTNALLTIVDDEFIPPPNISGEFNFSTYYDTNLSWIASFFGPGYFVTENESRFSTFCGREVLQWILPDRAALGAVVTVVRTGGAVGRVMVDWATTEGGTAIPFRDYTPTNGTFVFDDYQMSTNIVVPVRSDFTPSGHKFIRLVLSNPRPAPEEEAERPGIIRPTLGPGASSQIVILEQNHGEYGLLLNTFNFTNSIFSISNYVPAFSFERVNYRVDEYDDDATSVSGGVRAVNVDVIFPFTPVRGTAGGQCIVRTSDPRVRFPILRNPFTQPGSDLAEAYQNGGTPYENDPDPFSGQRIYPNPTFTDPALGPITNRTDYFATNTTVTFGQNDCRRRITLYITNDATVEFDEDIRLELVGILGQQYFPSFWGDQCTVTILYHDQPAGAVDREWNPDNVAVTGPDQDFNRNPGANDIVYAVAVQPDQKTLIAGDFSAYNGIPVGRIARLLTNGLIDTSFNAGSGAERAITGLLQYPTNSPNFGKILVSGSFPSFNGFLHSGITRLLPNGPVDSTFNPGKGANGPIWSAALQSDGKIIVVGSFSQYNNVARHNIARLHPNGDLDVTFDCNPGPDFTVRSVAVVPNGFGPEKILIGGDFFFVSGVPYFGVAQLLGDGSLDPAFNSGAGANGTVYSVLLQTNGLPLIAGSFSQYNDVRRMGIARLLPDGSLDPTFDPAYGADKSVFAMTLQPDGKIFIGGAFAEYNTTRRMALARLRYDGTLDTSFLDTAYNQFAGFTHPVSFLPPNYVTSIALQADGNVMVGGSFTNVGGNPAARHVLRNSHTVFTRADKRNRFNVARLLGGVTPGPGNAQFEADDYAVDENASTVSIRMDRTDGRLGELLGLAVTTQRFASAGVDYTSSTNNRPWLQHHRFPFTTFEAIPVPFSVGQVGPEYFKIPILDDLLEEGDELVDLNYLKAVGSLNLSGEIIPLGAALGRSSATMNIVDNDRPRGEFNFLLSQYVTNEFKTNLIFAEIVVIRTNGFHGLTFVDYFTRNSTNTPIATAGSDYDIARGQLRFDDGVTTNSFLVRIRDDDIVEFDENIELVLTNAIGARLPGGKKSSIATATLTIVDNDFEYGRVNFSSTTFTNAENEGFASIRVTRTGGSVGTVSVQYRTTNGTALSSSDYQSTSGTLTWNNGDIAFKTIQVPLSIDGSVEGTENFRILLFDPRIGGVTDTRLLGNRTNSLVYIADADAYGTLAFNQPYYQADENGGMVSIPVIRVGGSSGSVSINYAATPDSAAPGVDFTPVSGTLQFAPGQTSTNFIVPLADDTESDGNKVVRLQLSTPINATLGLPDAVDLTLVDNESNANPPGENDRNFEQTPGANGPVYALSLYLTNGIFDGRVMIAGDFTNVNNTTRQGLARLKPNSTLDPTFDPGIGPDGAVRAMLVQPDGKIVFAGSFSHVTGTNRSGIARLNIEGTLDRSYNPGAGADGPIYALAMQPDEKIYVGGAFSRFNDEELHRLIRLTTNAVVDPTFDVGAGPNGIIYAIALQSDGKVLVGGEFTQFDGVTTPGLVRLRKDGRVDSTFNTGLGFNGTVRAIAVQSDGKIVVGGSFTTANGTVRNSLARLDSFGALDTAFMAGLEGADNTIHALALQVDGKIVAAGDFTRFHGVNRNRITRLNTDGTTDPTINFGSGADSFISALAIQPDRKIVIAGGFTTFDDLPRRRFARLYGGSIAGPGVLEFSLQPFLADENATNATVVVRRRGGTVGSVGVDFQTVDGTALAARDYIATNKTLSFPQGEAIQNISIRLLDNFTPNIDRELGLQLLNFVGTSFGARPTSSLIILNDETVVGFSVTNFVAGEGDPSHLASITVTRTLGTNTPFSVSYGTGGGTASPFFDYTPTNGTLIFNKGDMSKTFQVPILEDTFIEDDETVNLILQSPSQRAFLGVDRSILTILDNEVAPGQLLLSSATYSVDEAGGAVDILILRTNGRTGFITVDIGTADVSAVAGADYVRTNNTITFGPGEVAKTFRIPILVDFISEPSETFDVLLSNPQYGAVLLSPSSARVTILNNDRPYGTFQFSAGTRSVVEGNVILPISVYRVNGPVSNATVNFATAPLTATSNVDYRQTNGTLFFGPGVTNQTINVQILDDGLQEGTETFSVTLSGANGGAGLGSPSSTIVSITDNDSPIIIAAGATLVSEVTTNGVIDAGERVTLRLGLKNVGFVNTANLTATVQLTGGVVSPSPVTATYGALIANGAIVFQNIALTANVTNNGTLTVTLALRDGTRDLGTATYMFRVGATTYTFYNPSQITILDNTNAIPYPSTIQVSDLSGTISKVSVTVSNMTHGYPDDIDILLVGPSGTNVMLMSDAGGFNPIQDVTINYTDFAPSAPSDTGQLFSGDCLPSNYGAETGGDVFSPPAPPTPYTVTRLSIFNGQSPNGTWSLYVADDDGGDAGVIAGGWSLTLSVSELVNTPQSVMYCVGMQANGQFRMAVRGQPGQRYSVQASSDLSQYSNVHTFIMPNSGLYEFQDTNSSSPRFFRAIKGQ